MLILRRMLLLLVTTVYWRHGNSLSHLLVQAKVHFMKIVVLHLVLPGPHLIQLLPFRISVRHRLMRTVPLLLRGTNPFHLMHWLLRRPHRRTQLIGFFRPVWINNRIARAHPLTGAPALVNAAHAARFGHAAAAATGEDEAAAAAEAEEDKEADGR